MPAVQVRRLREVGVSTKKNRLESCRPAQRDGLVELFRRAFSRWAIARPVHDRAGPRRCWPGDDEGVIAPVPLVRDVHAFLALARWS